MQVSTTFEFCASHCLYHLPPEHKCSRLHGHNYSIVVNIEGAVKDDNFVIDFGDVKEALRRLIGHWDHRHISHLAEAPPLVDAGFLKEFGIRSDSVVYFGRATTAENMADHICKGLWNDDELVEKAKPETITVEVWETKNSFARTTYAKWASNIAHVSHVMRVEHQQP